MKLRWNWNRWPLALLTLLLAGPVVSAHEKWYVDPSSLPTGLPIFLRLNPIFVLVTIGVVFALFLLATWLDRRFDDSHAARWFDARITSMRLSPHVILGTLIGVALMGAGLQHTLFAPNLELPATAWGSFLAWAQILLGTLFLFLEPLYAELGLLLALLFLAGFTVAAPMDLLEDLLIFGAAIYLMMNETIRAPWRSWNTHERCRLGYQAFRILVGVNFLILALVKWARPELALGIVTEYHLNFLSQLHVSDLQFVFFAAIVETSIALCLLLRIAFRPAVVMAFLFFTLSIYFLGFKELLGHLPIKATLFLFFVYGHWHAGERKP